MSTTLPPRINSVLFLLIAFGILSCAFALSIWLSPPPGSPPDIERAQEDFTSRYSAAAVNEISFRDEHALARTFAFDYRNKASGQMGRLSVRYTRRGDGTWEMQPDLPAQLP
jgi:hypothetical protein